MAHLEVIQGANRGAEHVLGELATLGRDGANHIVLFDEQVSRRHAEIGRHGGLFMLKDYGSANGTFVNGVQIQEHLLRNGDEVVLGQTVLRFLSDVSSDTDLDTSTIMFDSTPTPSKPRAEVDVKGSLYIPFETEANVDVLRKQVERLQAVAKANEVIGTVLDIREVLEKILELVFDTLPADRGFIMLKDEKTDELKMEIVRTRDGKVPPGTTVSMTIANRALSCKVGILTNPLEDLMDQGGPSASIVFQNILSAICVPLVCGDNVLGIINVDSTRTEHAFSEEDLRMLSAISAPAAVAIENAQLYQKQKATFYQTIRALARQVDAKDPYSYGHSERVASFSRAIAEEMGLSKELVELTYLSGMLHDVGKIGVPDNILGKPGRLSDEEFDQLKEHPAKGGSVIDEVELLREIVPGIREHHEKFDGSGYPQGLSESEISLAGRIIAVADTFDAMTSDRPYRKRLPDEVAFEELHTESGKQFDAEVVRCFLDAYKNGKITSDDQWSKH